MKRHTILRDNGPAIEWTIGRAPYFENRWGRKIVVRRTWGIRDLRRVFDRRGRQV